MKIKYYGLEDELEISPYTTAQEKEMLLLQEYENDEEYIIRQMLEIVGVSSDVIKKMSMDDCKALLYKFREISIDNEIEIRYKCPHCGSAVSATVSCANIVKIPEYEISTIKNLHRLPKNEQDFIDNFLTDGDNIPIGDYEHLLEIAPDYQTLYDFYVSLTCPLCKGKTKSNIGKPKFLISAMSEDSLKSIFQSYELLIHYGNWSKSDIDGLIPFERKIFISLLTQSLEKRSRARQ